MRWCEHARLCVLAVGVLSTSAALAQDAAERLFKQNDRNGDGKLSREEFPEKLREKLFDRIDTNADGQLTLEEDRAFRRGRAKGGQPDKRGGARTSDAVVTHRDIPYAATKNPRQTLTLVLPKKPASDKPLPVVAFIHGGGWQNGDKAGGVGKVVPFVTTGNYAGVSIGYRLSGEAIWPAQIHDCKAAIRWIRANATKHNLDADRIAVWGSSAGGHLVAMLGTSADVKEMDGTLGENTKQSTRVACVADWFGPTDLLQMDAKAPPGARMVHDSPNSPESKLIGGPIQENKAKVATANPITYVTKDDPPFLIAHGTVDPLVAFNQSELLTAALKKAGCDVLFLHIVGAGHGGFNSPEVDRRMQQFFDKQLRGQDAMISDKPIQAGKKTAPRR